MEATFQKDKEGSLTASEDINCSRIFGNTVLNDIMLLLSSFCATQAEMIIVLILFWKPYKSKGDMTLDQIGTKGKESCLQRFLSIFKNNKKPNQRNINFKFYDDAKDLQRNMNESHANPVDLNSQGEVVILPFKSRGDTPISNES